MTAQNHLAPGESVFKDQDRIEDQARQAWALSEFLLAYHNDQAAGEGLMMSTEIVCGLLENLCDRLEAIREINDPGSTKPIHHQ